MRLKLTTWQAKPALSINSNVERIKGVNTLILGLLGRNVGVHFQRMDRTNNFGTLICWKSYSSWEFEGQTFHLWLPLKKNTVENEISTAFVRDIQNKRQCTYILKEPHITKSRLYQKHNIISLYPNLFQCLLQPLIRHKTKYYKVHNGSKIITW